MEESDPDLERAVRFPGLPEFRDLVQNFLDVPGAVEGVVRVFVQRFEDVLGTSLRKNKQFRVVRH